MANTVILGVYETKTALDTAELATATTGDTYIVGAKIPYTLYAYDGTKFAKGYKVSDVVSDLDTPVTIDDVTETPAVSKLFTQKWKGTGEKIVQVRRTLHLGEIEFFTPSTSE